MFPQQERRRTRSEDELLTVSLTPNLLDLAAVMQAEGVKADSVIFSVQTEGRESLSV